MPGSWKSSDKDMVAVLVLVMVIVIVRLRGTNTNKDNDLDDRMKNPSWANNPCWPKKPGSYAGILAITIARLHGF